MPKQNYLTHEQILKLIEENVSRAGTQFALAEEWGVNGSYLSNIRKGKQLPGPTICRRLKKKAVVVYFDED